MSSGSLQISNGYNRVLKSRLHNKIERFANEDLPLLIDKGFVQSTMFNAAPVTEFRSVTGNCNAQEKKTSKNGIKDAQNSERIAPGFIHAPWSGGK